MSAKVSQRLSREQVLHVAKLARLALSPAEVEAMERDLSAILGYVEKLAELDTKDVPPTAHAVELPARLRQDTPHQSLSKEAALKNAPERLGDGFGVPKVIE